MEINYSTDDDFFLQVTGNANQRGWGSTGSNGAQCVFTADDQDCEGKIVYDSISTLDFYLINESELEGYFIDDESWAGDGGDGYCNVYISADSEWTVTGDSTVTALCNAGTIEDENDNTVTIKGTDGTVYVQGTSSYTITVESYSTDDMSANAGTCEAYSTYAADEPTV